MVCPYSGVLLSHKNKLLPATTQMNLENIRLSVRSQTQKATLYDSIYLKHPEYGRPQGQSTEQVEEGVGGNEE